MSTHHDSDKPISSGLSEQEVAAYLRQHPDFFERHLSLLTELTVPHNTGGGAVSLVERQVELLRAANQKQQKQLDDLIQIARENEHLNTQLHEFTLQLMQCVDLAGMLAFIQKRLLRDFHVDEVSLHLFVPPKDPALAQGEAFVLGRAALSGPFQRVLDAGKPYCGKLKDEQVATLFNTGKHEIASAVALPLGQGGSLGLLGIGSQDRLRFQPSADTNFLLRMAQVISTGLSRHLQLEDQ
jgi:uncharacterized protein YigA (DUF484 family)